MLNRILEAVVALLMALTAIIGFSAVVARYGFGQSFSWSYEVLQALLVYMTFISAYLALRRGAHLRIDILFNRLPGSAQVVIYTINQLIIAGVGFVMAFWGYRQTAKFFWRQSLILEFPIGFLYGIIPLCGAAIIIHALGKIPYGLGRIRRGLPAHPDTDPFSAETMVESEGEDK